MSETSGEKARSVASESEKESKESRPLGSTETGPTPNPGVSSESKQKETSSSRESGSTERAGPTGVRQASSSSSERRRRAKHMMVWTMTGFFDFNPHYFLQMRGILNAAHIILSMILLIILGRDCQKKLDLNYKHYRQFKSEGFFCKTPETFLFVTACCSFLTSSLYLFCCLLSKRTEEMLYQTSLEIGYFILYFILFLTSSVAVAISVAYWSSDVPSSDYNHAATQSTVVIGLLNSSMYGLSSVWFFISHRYYRECPDD